MTNYKFVRNLTGRLTYVLRHLLEFVQADSLSFGLLIGIPSNFSERPSSFASLEERERNRSIQLLVASNGLFVQLPVASFLRVSEVSRRQPRTYVFNH